jgi:hypothetical protein
MRLTNRRRRHKRSTNSFNVTFIISTRALFIKPNIPENAIIVDD